MCANQAHPVDLHLWRGFPESLDETRPVQILINQGYIVGFSPDALQSAYRVADSDHDVDYERPLLNYEVMRPDGGYRIGRGTLSSKGSTI